MAPVRSVVIVGGGTAGWMTAASLAHALTPLGIGITLIESSQIGTVGVGEATVPTIRRYVASLGLDMAAVMAATHATYKLGIRFQDWRTVGHDFFHPFGPYGIASPPLDFVHLWMRLRAAGENHPLSDYSLGAQMAYAGTFRAPDPNPGVDFEAYDWAIHFDAGAFAGYLRAFAERTGVVRIDATVADVGLDAISGDIASVTLADGRTVTGDLFIDCSGFRGLLIQGALKAGYVDWGQWLLCDRAVALPCRNPDPDNLAPLTAAHARGAGWTWSIPLQHRIGNGYVYSSRHLSDAAAEAQLRAVLPGDALAAPNFQRFTPGHARAFWAKNCVAIGLAGGFLEPLESTSISLIQAGIDKLIQMWPTDGCDPRISEEYNRISQAEYERVRDFIIVHYALNRRHDEAFWDDARNITLPDTLAHKIELFRARGHFVRYPWESFFDPSWMCMYEGFGIVPQGNSPFAALIPIDDLTSVAAQVRADIRAMAQAAPRHAQAVAAIMQPQQGSSTTMIGNI